MLKWCVFPEIFEKYICKFSVEMIVLSFSGDARSYFVTNRQRFS